MVDTVHDQKMAKTYAGMIRGAKRGRRRAFALGQLGSFPVVAVVKGKPTTAASTLRKMEFESGKAPPTVTPKAQVRPLTHGLLYLDEKKTLVLQCRVKPPTTAVQGLKKYFRFLKAPVPWGPVKVVRLNEDDDGDVDDGSPDTEVAEDGASDVPSDAADDDAIEDAWSDDAEPAPTAAASAPTDNPVGEPPHDPPSDPPDAGETAAKRAADAKAVAEHVGRMAPLLHNQGDSSPEDLQRTFEAMLENVSPERLLLALSYSQNLADLRNVVAQAPKEPIEHDGTGIATIASALARMGAKLGRERGFIGAHEAVDPDRLEAMVRKHWDGKPVATPQQIIQELNTVLAQSFAMMPPAKSRALLGLQGSQPAPVEERPEGRTPDQASESSGEGSATREKLERARRAWEEGKSLAIAGIDQLKSEFVREYGEDKDEAAVLAASLRRLEELKARLAESLDSVLSEAEPERHSEPLPVVLAAVGQMETFIKQDALMVELAGREYLPQVIIVPPLQEALMEMRTVLSA